ncbi:hypothetical protein ATANTOWER_026567 [Ataeniobius toweri]|uniref:Uncharacterized protein n=1 Tax=Ataeniobius toweri TaxID=208326 RepID=A0ABU7CIQ8_9TELE|nr:hypothetical protein [Ataeniobius toweri]
MSSFRTSKLKPPAVVWMPDQTLSQIQSCASTSEFLDKELSSRKHKHWAITSTVPALKLHLNNEPIVGLKDLRLNNLLWEQRDHPLPLQAPSLKSRESFVVLN